MGETRLRRVRATVGAVLAVALVATGLSVLQPWDASAAPASLQQGFVEETVLSGLTQPTAVRFSPDGRVFVAEKSGLVKVFDSLTATTPAVFADLRTNVHNFWDRGLLGLALDPNFPTTPAVYVSYTHDAAIGGTAPRWGAAGVTNDPCPTPPGPNGDGCVVSGRVSRLTAAGNVMTGAEQVLVEDWCQQYPSHSMSGLAFGPDGMLYVGGGDGANYNFTDYGQDGDPVNPCGDPGGAAPAPPTAEGGALRSQDLRTSGDPLGLNGSILRIDPATGAGVSGNPLGSSSDANARRIVATGLRNPFRIAVRPGTNELWVGDVGAGDNEEIDVVAFPTDGSVDNFGWPCYEGAARQAGFEATGLSICQGLYAVPGAVADPFFTYRHSNKVVPNEACPSGSSSISGLAFAPVSGGSYPVGFAGAAFFSDYSRDCIWVMKAGADGRPSPNLIETFASGATNPVDLQTGPGGMLYYVDLWGGEIRRIRYAGETTPPTVTTVTPARGAASVVIDVNVSAVFSEPLDASTVNSSTTTLRAGGVSGAPVTAAVTYDAATNRAVLDPVSPLAASSTYTAVVKGGSPGVKDVAGNPLVADDSWSFTTAAPSSGPVNDGFGAARVLSGSSGSLSDASTVGASKESGEPAHTGNAGGASVWFGWVAPSGGQATIATSGSSFDTLLGVYTGSGVSGLTVVASNDDISGAVFQSSVSFAAVAGTTYQVAVDGWRHGSGVVETGAVTLSWSSPGVSNPNAPVPEIIEPSIPTPWAVGDVITFRGTATDPQDGLLPPTALSWSVLLLHCPSNCHSHPYAELPGVAAGSIVAPDHEYPSHLELRLTATDSSGLATTVTRRLDPRTVDLGFVSNPPGLQIAVDGATTTAPFARTVIVGSTHSVAAPATQSLGGNDYEFVSWSDGGARVHQVSASPGMPALLTALYRDVSPPRVVSVWPAAGATSVGRGWNATATFSNAMHPATITTATIRLRVGGSTGALVAVNVFYDAATRTASIDPVPTLAANTTYAVVVDGGAAGVRDLSGTPLAASYTWSFRTR